MARNGADGSARASAARRPVQSSALKKQQPKSGAKRPTSAPTSRGKQAASRQQSASGAGRRRPRSPTYVSKRKMIPPRTATEARLLEKIKSIHSAQDATTKPASPRRGFGGGNTSLAARGMNNGAADHSHQSHFSPKAEYFGGGAAILTNGAEDKPRASVALRCS